MEKVQKRTKIVATLGPASSDRNILKSMIAKGVDVCRLNFSHGTQDEHLTVIETIRSINAEYEYINTSIVADLQGPKIRIGQMSEAGAILEDGATIEIHTTEEFIGDKNRLYISYEQFPQ